MLWLLLACTSDDSDTLITPVETGDTYIEWPDDTGEQGTDEDGDNWSVEDGDCDDSDIYVHPGWEESEEEGNAADGKDNDCDGQIDESFRGLWVLQQGRFDQGTAARMVRVNRFGEQAEEVVFSDASVQPFWYTDMAGKQQYLSFTVTPQVDGAGWVVCGVVYDQNDTFVLFEISETGEVRTLATLEGQGYGITTHPDGYYLVATFSGLLKVEPTTGAATEVASFIDAEENPLIYSFDVAVDRITGTIGVFGYSGGFATVDPESFEVTYHKQLDPEVPVEQQNWAGAHWDSRDGWYVGGQDADGWAVFRWDEAEQDWARKASFAESWTPKGMTLDTVYGDYYMSTKGAQDPTVWRLDAAEGENPDKFFTSPNGGTYFLDVWDLYTIYFD